MFGVQTALNFQALMWIVECAGRIQKVRSRGLAQTQVQSEECWREALKCLCSSPTWPKLYWACRTAKQNHASFSMPCSHIVSWCFSSLLKTWVLSVALETHQSYSVCHWAWRCSSLLTLLWVSWENGGTEELHDQLGVTNEVNRRKDWNVEAPIPRFLIPFRCPVLSPGLGREVWRQESLVPFYHIRSSWTQNICDFTLWLYGSGECPEHWITKSSIQVSNWWAFFSEVGRGKGWNAGKPKNRRPGLNQSSKIRECQVETQRLFW